MQIHNILNLIKNNINSRFYYVFIITAHIALLILLGVNFGFNTANEGDKYLTEAIEFTKGNINKAFDYQLLYSAYIIYLSVFVFLKLPVEIIFITTYVLSLFTYYKFSLLLIQLKGKLFSRIWLTLMLLSPLIQYWHFNLFSESFFIAISLLSVYLAFYQKVNHRSIKLLIIALLLFFTRPLGIALSIFIILFYLNHEQKISTNNTYKLIITLGLIIGVYFLFFYKLHFLGMAAQISSGAIYFGFPTLSKNILAEGNYTLYECYYFIYSHYGTPVLLSIWMQKLSSFFLLTRPYYSSFHNFINIVHYLFYFFALITLLNHRFKKSNFNKINSLILLYVLASVSMVGLFFNEWSERYTVVVFPFIFVISVQGMYIVLKKINKIVI